MGSPIAPLYMMPVPDPPPYVPIIEMSQQALKKALQDSTSTWFILPQGYGDVVMVGLSTVCFLTWNMIKIYTARRDFLVPSPLFTDKDLQFNCICRAHHSMVEMYSEFLFTLLVGGLEMPFFCTVAGYFWLASRYCKAKAYYYGFGKPESFLRPNFLIMRNVFIFLGYLHPIGSAMLWIAALRCGIKRMF